jgi:acetyl-CoA synthetase
VKNRETAVVNNQFNIGHICTRKQCDLGKADKTALRWISPALEKTDYSYLDMEKRSNQIANALIRLGTTAGDRVFVLLPRSPDIYFIFLGTLKIQAITGVLFSNFGEEALLDRLGDSRARVLFTKKNYLRRINSIWPRLPSLEKVIVIDLDEDQSDRILSGPRLLATANDDFLAAPTAPETPSVIHYTSGSTGKSKGAQHVHRSILQQTGTFSDILSVRPDDIYWCTADPGWVTGISYGIIGPMSQGVTQIQFGGNYLAETWFRILQEEKVNIWYTAPTALRMLMKEDENLFRQFDLGRLRHIFSVGEPLNPAVIEWARRVLDKDIFDTWWQTEAGAIMIANHPGLPIRPGSMGKPYDRIEAAILDEEGSPLPPMEQGRLCLKPGWPSMFVAYLNKESQYASRFKNGYYDTGDMAYQDAEGYFWFVGRSDDVINTAGHLVGPFEVESALLEIDEVAEAGVIAAPDEMLYEKVIAFVHLRPNVAWSRELELKLRLQVSNRVSSVATPQEFRVVDAIPKNKSGKIMRRVLKALYTGTDAGDLSTMEEYNQ